MDIQKSIAVAKKFMALRTKYMGMHCSNAVPASVADKYNYCLRKTKDGSAIKVTILAAAPLLSVFTGYELAESADGSYYLCCNTPTNFINEEAIYTLAEHSL